MIGCSSRGGGQRRRVFVRVGRIRDHGVNFVGGALVQFSKGVGATEQLFKYRITYESNRYLQSQFNGLPSIRKQRNRRS